MISLDLTICSIQVLTILSIIISIQIPMINCLQTTPIPPPPSVSVPVYSLATAACNTATDTDTATGSTSSTSTSTSMNIVTFATPVSIQPKFYMISLYRNTRTKDTFFESKYGILQLLDRGQKDLVPLLGKRSGYEDGYDKGEACRGVGFPWGVVQSSKFFAKIEGISEGDNVEDKDEDGVEVEDGNDNLKDIHKFFDGMSVLPRCQSYIAVKMMNTMEGGDHELALCEVLGVGEWDEQQQCVVCANGVTEPKNEESVLYTGYLRSEGII